MAYLLDSNLLIYSAEEAHAFLRPLVQSTANYVSAISQVETLEFHRLGLVDKSYLESVFTILGVFCLLANQLSTSLLVCANNGA
jgi:toxin FitB